MTVDLDNLTPEQADVAHRFLDMLLAGHRVSAIDFPELPQDEFEALAEAMCAATRGPLQ